MGMQREPNRRPMPDVQTCLAPEGAASAYKRIIPDGLGTDLQ